MRTVRFAGLLLIAAIAIGVAGSFRLRALLPMGIDAQSSNADALPDYGPAPELLSTAWLNTDQPLRLAGLRGQVVLLQFWTFGCINCQHTLPYVQAWYTAYHDDGLAVIGNHYPEYSYERELQNVAASLRDWGVTYPIAQDNSGATWIAYNQLYWPTFYLIDKQGHIRYRSYGEGNYEAIEAAIMELLAEDYPIDIEPAALSESYITPLQPVSVYLSPSQDDDVLGIIGEQSAFVVLEEREGWYRISYNDHDGFVAADPEHLLFVAGSAAN